MYTRYKATYRLNVKHYYNDTTNYNVLTMKTMCRYVCVCVVESLSAYFSGHRCYILKHSSSTTTIKLQQLQRVNRSTGSGRTSML
jgi:hypothetical protein